MSSWKQLLALAVALTAVGGMATGVVLLRRTPDGDDPKGAMAKTPTTSVAKDISKEQLASKEELAKRPQPRPRLPRDRTGAVSFIPDGKRAAMAPQDWSASGSKVTVFDTSTWKEVASLDITAEGKIVGALAITPDAKRVILAGIGGPKVLRVWDTTTNKYEEKTLDLGFERLNTMWLKVSPDGKRLVGYLEQVPDMRQIRVWDVASGEVIRTFDVPPFGDGWFTFTDDGKTVAASTWGGTVQEPKSSVVEWDLDTGKEKRRFEMMDAVPADRGPPLATAVAYTPDGKQLVIGGGIVLPEVPAESMDPKKYVVNTFPWSGCVWVIDRDTGKLAKTLLEARHDLVRSLRVAGDGKKLIVNPSLPSRWDRTFEPDQEFVELQQWDVATWELDWVKIVPATERWKLMNGAAK